MSIYVHNITKRYNVYRIPHDQIQVHPVPEPENRVFFEDGNVNFTLKRKGKKRRRAPSPGAQGRGGCCFFLLKKQSSMVTAVKAAITTSKHPS